MATKQKYGFPDVKTLRSPGLIRMIGTVHSAYFTVTKNRISYDRYAHQFSYCPRTRGKTQDTELVVGLSSAPFLSCPDCTAFSKAAAAEDRRRQIESGNYRPGPGDSLIHVECGKTKGSDCSCFDL